VTDGADTESGEKVAEPDLTEPSRLPDDPGVDPSQDQDKSERRFRLF
jgi:uncharacterized membrane-anchored protein